MGSLNELSLTPRFSGVEPPPVYRNRFSGFPHPVETAEAVLKVLKHKIAPLKRGVNETDWLSVRTIGSLPASRHCSYHESHP
jgi:hypothetical protein